MVAGIPAEMVVPIWQVCRETFRVLGLGVDSF
jgi:hypothetical protein